VASQSGHGAVATVDTVNRNGLYRIAQPDRHRVTGRVESEVDGRYLVLGDRSPTPRASAARRGPR